MRYTVPKTSWSGLAPKHTQYYEVDVSDLSVGQMQLLCGPLDEHFLLLEQKYRVRIGRRGSNLIFQGPSEALSLATESLKKILRTVQEKKTLSVDQIRNMVLERDVSNLDVLKKQSVLKNHSQACYWELMSHKTITFGIGPAGTGKTYLAVAKAVELYERGEVDRIILTRPAVEAGERLGFLPGDLQQKIDPYLRPLFDALIEFLGSRQVDQMIQQHQIEMAPLGFMRGRTLSRAFIILDEAQNTTQTQMKLFLTRLGFQSKMVVTGDISQIDLDDPRLSGLQHVVNLLSQVDDIGFYFFQKNDIVRHHLITKILEAYGDV